MGSRGPKAKPIHVPYGKFVLFNGIEVNTHVISDANFRHALVIGIEALIEQGILKLEDIIVR